MERSAKETYNQINIRDYRLSPGFDLLISASFLSEILQGVMTFLKFFYEKCDERTLECDERIPELPVLQSRLSGQEVFNQHIIQQYVLSGGKTRFPGCQTCANISKYCLVNKMKQIFDVFVTGGVARLTSYQNCEKRK